MAQNSRVDGDNDNRNVTTTLTVEGKTKSTSTGTFTQYSGDRTLTVPAITLEDGRTISAKTEIHSYQSGETGVGYKTKVTIYLYVNSVLVAQNYMDYEGDIYADPSVTISKNLAGIGYICGKIEGAIESATIVFN